MQNYTPHFEIVFIASHSPLDEMFMLKILSTKDDTYYKRITYTLYVLCAIVKILRVKNILR